MWRWHVSEARFEINGSTEGVTPNPMKLKLVSSITFVVLLSGAVFAQAGGSSAALPSAPGAAEAAAAPAPDPNATKVVVINVEGAIFATNEAQRDLAALQKKFEPKMNELKTKSDEIDALKKKLGAATTTDVEKVDLNRQIEQKQKLFDRARQDAQEDAQGQQGEIGQRIFQKIAPVVMKYAAENNVGMIVDISSQWPQGPVLWANPPLDITKAIVDAYNAQSGVPAPAAGTAPAKPAGGTTRPTAPATKPATPPAK